MGQGRVRRVQDPVHGLMEFFGVESVVIDVLRTPELQRLRRIRQTGLAYLVFPGAEHSRLVHSLGASFLALRFGRHLQEASRGVLADLLAPTEVSIRDFAVAALCHDLGHGPLSHAWERGVVGPGFNRDAWISSLGLKADAAHLADRKWHEIVGQAFLAWEDGQLHQLLEQHEAGFSGRVRRLLLGDYYLSYLPRLLSSDIDVDRADFLIRDAYQSGVAYGRYDLNWLISTCTFGRVGERTVVGFDRRKATKVVEQFLVARSALYDTVYQHKTVRSAEGMVEQFLKRCRETPSTIPAGAYRLMAPVTRILAGETLGVEELIGLDDYVLWTFISELAQSSTADPTARDIAGRIVARDLFKMVPCKERTLDEFLQKPDAYARLWQAVRPFVAGDPKFYVHVDRVEFEWFATREPERAYFVNDEGIADSIGHEDLQHFPVNERRGVRLYTVREAVPALYDVVRGL